MSSNSQVRYLSKEKFEELTTELDRLKNEDRKRIATELEYARSLGDLKENAEYHEARNAQADLEDRIFELENILKTATIVSGQKKDVVCLGCEVVLENSKNKEQKSFKIVGSEESDIMANKISNVSPLGMTALGKKVGDSFVVKTPGGEVSFKIIEIK